jgi:hypothetical protein
MRLRALVALAALALACSSPNRLSRQELLDPETCRDCHPEQYEEWASSMHAYAADDPVFLAMNELGQRETGGALGDFCVQCHAPMALREGATTDGLNLAEVPQHLKGVTCFFCHSAESITDDHNNPIVLATDLAMRGQHRDPVESNAHDSVYSALLDGRDVAESSRMCGSCHDIITPAGVHLERTYVEWQDSVFNKPRIEGGSSCNTCHMEVSDGVIAEVEGVPFRPSGRREHAWPGVDIAVTPWPGQDLQLFGIERDLFFAITPTLCFNPANGGQIEYTLDNSFGGHMLPSGATQDRRMWAEVVATSGGATALASGVVAEGQPVAEVAAGDPMLWQMRDFVVDENGDEAHFFWEAREVESELLPPAVTNDPEDPDFVHSVTRIYPLAGAPERIEAQVHIRPIGLEIIDILIAETSLDPAVRDALPTFTIDGTRLVWTAEAAGADGCVDRQSSAE